IISLMAGMDLADICGDVRVGHCDAWDTPVFADQADLDESLAAVESVFGTPTSPTTGTFYNIGFADFQDIVENDIIKDVLDVTRRPLHNIVIEDFFPADILNNFDFNLAGQPNLGVVTPDINSSTNSLVWTLPELHGNSAAVLRYTLTLRDMNDESLIDRTFSTNERVVLNYEDDDGDPHTVILDNSPSVRLVRVPGPPNTAGMLLRNPFVVGGFGLAIAFTLFALTRKQKIA
ncbi:hypothetical protein FWH09_02425, partial [Candidatus Saccharibacteria bacterium]|nr:hypothetical protein [Candidatus Saccharibacteria bacterium]